MARSKAQKRKVRRKKQAERMAAMTPARLLPLVMRGRKKDGPVGPTPETLAKHRPDTLQMLRDLRINGEPFLDADLVEAGHQIMRAWKLFCPNGFPSGGSGGGDPKPTDRLEAHWLRWCGPPSELYRRCYVTPGKVADWLRDSAACDRDPKGAAGVLKRALEWWRQAARDVPHADCDRVATARQVGTQR